MSSGRAVKTGHLVPQSYFAWGCFRYFDSGTPAASFLQLPATDDPKPRVRRFLAAQGNRVDREPVDSRCRKPLTQHRHDGFAPFCGKPSRQRHVETKFFEHVWVAPTAEIVALPRRQFVGIAPC